LTREISQWVDEAGNRTLAMKVHAEKISDTVQLMHAGRLLIVAGTAAGLSLAELWATHLRLMVYPVQVILADPAQAAPVKRQLERDISDNWKCPCRRVGPRLAGPLLSVAADVGQAQPQTPRTPHCCPRGRRV